MAAASPAVSLPHIGWPPTAVKGGGRALMAATTALRQLADRKADDFFARRGYEGAADFLAHYHRLSGVVLRPPGGIALWQNPIARHKLRPDIATAIERLSI